MSETPIVSDQEKEFAEEEKRRDELFWKSIPLIMRNRETIYKVPDLYNIPLSFIYISGFFHSFKDTPIRLGTLVHIWRDPAMHVHCTSCGKDEAYYMPSITERGHCPFIDSLLGEKPLEMPADYSAFCETCNKIVEVAWGNDFIGDHNNIFYDLLTFWNRQVEYEVSRLPFERAIQLLELKEIFGEDITKMLD